MEVKLEINSTEAHIDDLRGKSRQIRKMVLDMIYKAQSGHLGGSMSVVEILSALYFSEMDIDPQNPGWEDRDRLIPSKGHCAPALYSALVLKGVVQPDSLDELRQISCILQGHPCMNKVPGIDISTGSLGHGLSIGLGMALGSRIVNKSFNVFVLLGDGELDEGQNWEAAMASSKYKVSNLIAIVDRNRVQLDGPTESIMPLEPLEEKWKAFNWNTQEVDGHDIKDIIKGLQWAKSNQNGPSVIIANTKKGKGVSFMEDKHQWHGKPPSEEEYLMAKKELEGGTDV